MDTAEMIRWLENKDAATCPFCDARGWWIDMVPRIEIDHGTVRALTCKSCGFLAYFAPEAVIGAEDTSAD
ncbi:MAG: hypothetical protein OXG27_02165 [Chloroflexi bacterium]|nr:hypothetical protein [Chloroflexota bacterium]